MSVDPYAAIYVANCEKAARGLADLRQLATEGALTRTRTGFLVTKVFLYFKPDPLHTPRVTTSPSDDDVLHLQFWYALHGINVLTSRMSRLLDMPQELELVCDVIIKEWDDIWKWVEIGTWRGAQQEKHPLPEEQFDLLISSLACLVHTCSCYSEGLRKNLFEKGYNALIDLWYIQTCHPSQDAVTMGIPSLLLYGLYDCQLPRPEMDSGNMEEYWSKIIKRTGRPGAEIARLLLLRFLHLLKSKQNTQLSILPHIDIITCLTSAASVHNLLTTFHSTYFFTRSLIHFSYDTKTTAPFLTDPDRIAIRERICLYLTVAFKSTKGIAWIRRSLDAGLLLAILRSAPRAPNEDVRELCVLVNFICRYLIYLSVLRPLARTMNKLNLPRMERNIAKEGPFWDAWTILKELVDQRLIIAGSRITKRCSYAKCKHMDTLSDFKRCSGCHVASYCSIICQNLDWTDTGHRPSCKEVQLHPGMKDRQGVELSDEDFEFCKLVFSKDMLSKSKDIIAMYEKPQKPHHLHVRFDYCCFPPETTFTDLPNQIAGYKTYTAILPLGSLYTNLDVNTALAS